MRLKRIQFISSPAFAGLSCLFQFRNNFDKSSFFRHLAKNSLDEESENYKILPRQDKANTRIVQGSSCVC
jgi:hypothetical protein